MIPTIFKKYVLAGILLVAGNPFIMHAAAGGAPPSLAEFLAQGGDPTVRLQVPDGSGGYTLQRVKLMSVLQGVRDRIRHLKWPLTRGRREILRNCKQTVEHIRRDRNPNRYQEYELALDQIDLRPSPRPMSLVAFEDQRMFLIWQMSISLFRVCNLLLGWHAQRRFNKGAPVVPFYVLRWLIKQMSFLDFSYLTLTPARPLPLSFWINCLGTVAQLCSYQNSRMQWKWLGLGYIRHLLKYRALAPKDTLDRRLHTAGMDAEIVCSAASIYALRGDYLATKRSFQDDEYISRYITSTDLAVLERERARRQGVRELLARGNDLLLPVAWRGEEILVPLALWQVIEAFTYGDAALTTPADEAAVAAILNAILASETNHLETRAVGFITLAAGAFLGYTLWALKRGH